MHGSRIRDAVVFHCIQPTPCPVIVGRSTERPPLSGSHLIPSSLYARCSPSSPFRVKYENRNTGASESACGVGACVGRAQVAATMLRHIQTERLNPRTSELPRLTVVCSRAVLAEEMLVAQAIGNRTRRRVEHDRVIGQTRHFLQDGHRLECLGYVWAPAKRSM